MNDRIIKVNKNFCCAKTGVIGDGVGVIGHGRRFGTSASGAEHGLSSGRVRFGRRGQEFTGGSICQGHVQGHVRTHNRGQLPASHIKQQGRVHAANNRHDGQSSISGHATFEHTKRPCVHTCLFDNEPSIVRRAQGHLQGHCRNQRRCRPQKCTHDARRQQVRRELLP